MNLLIKDQKDIFKAETLGNVHAKPKVDGLASPLYGTLSPARSSIVYYVCCKVVCIKFFISLGFDVFHGIIAKGKYVSESSCHLTRDSPLSILIADELDRDFLPYLQLPILAIPESVRLSTGSRRKVNFKPRERQDWSDAGLILPRWNQHDLTW